MNDPKTIDIPSETSQAVAVRSEPGAVGAAMAPEDIPARAPVTAAQAKIDAVASLTMAAYQKAATLVITPEQSAALGADFPDEAFKPGAAGKEHLLYIEHAFLRDRLSSVFGMGQWAIIPRNRWAEEFTTAKGTPGSRVYVEAMLVIKGCFVGEAVGAMEYYPKNESQNYGDAVEGAKTAAFRRCAKELGVGLQAWKKDWCDGWWARRRGGRDFSKNAPGQAGSPGTTPRATPRAQNPAQPAPQAPLPPPAEKLWRQNEKTWLWVMQQLDIVPGGAGRDIASEYFRKAAGLLPNEFLEDLPLRFVPLKGSQLKALRAALAAFEQGEDAKLAFENEEPLAAKASPKPAAKPIEVPRDPAPPAPGAPPAHDPNDKGDLEWWRDVIVPIPHKGQKRAEYLKNPDTIGSLYDLRHEETADGADARKRLWGFVTNYEPKGWTKDNGTVMPASEGDKAFRVALDAFALWFEKAHPDEKL